MGKKLAEFLSKITKSTEEVRDDILLLRFTKVNACMVGYPHVEDPKWTLVDTGLENPHDFILDVVYDRYGMDLPPQAIILTHGHFDQIGSAISLSRHWDVPVFIHEKEIPEMPYVTGKNHIFPLAEGGTVPYMSQWRYIDTPGHTQGHISLFREKDRSLIVGDAFLPGDFKLSKESINKLKTLRPELAITSQGPPLRGQPLREYLEDLIKNYDEHMSP